MTVNVVNSVSERAGFSFRKTAEAVVKAVLDTEKLQDAVEVCVVITDNEGIRSLNSAHRGIDKETDVLSFPALDLNMPGAGNGLKPCPENTNPETGEIVLGDIVISAEKMRSQAREYGHSIRHEFAFLVAHSMLHLLGYDHERSGEEDSLTDAKQEKIMSLLGMVKPADILSAVRKSFKDKKRIVIKIGSASLAHSGTGKLDLAKLELLVRELCNLQNSGREVVLVSSGAVMVGRNTLGLSKGDHSINIKQACASVGQAKLMMLYQKLFSEYGHICSQILFTKNDMLDEVNRNNARNTFKELLKLNVIPIVNENDTVATYELDHISVFGDNDTLSAVVTALIGADLLILLSDIDGLYTDNPRENPDAGFVELVEKIDGELLKMGKSTTGSGVGTGGMATKLSAALIATASGADMVIANGADFHNIHRIVEGKALGTVFLNDRKDETFLLEYLKKKF